MYGRRSCYGWVARESVINQQQRWSRDGLQTSSQTLASLDLVEVNFLATFPSATAAASVQLNHLHLLSALLSLFFALFGSSLTMI